MTTADECLRKYLADQDTPCPGCSYNLRGLQSNHCPECGEALVLRVGLAEPNLAAFLAGLIGLAAGVGFHGFLLLWVLYMAVSQFSILWAQMLPSFVGLMVGLVGLFLWIGHRPRIRRMYASRRRALVLACWGWSFFTVLAFFALV
ncbi:MAG: hypothetical protein D6695_05405 [Planctomycetota bacterium]|nr:MAG: hypothetical protein D6695_05405 [Planctomycetota bacterium]